MSLTERWIQEVAQPQAETFHHHPVVGHVTSIVGLDDYEHWCSKPEVGTLTSQYILPTGQRSAGSLPANTLLQGVKIRVMHDADLERLWANAQEILRHHPRLGMTPTENMTFDVMHVPTHPLASLWDSEHALHSLIDHTTIQHANHLLRLPFQAEVNRTLREHADDVEASILQNRTPTAIEYPALLRWMSEHHVADLIRAENRRRSADFDLVATQTSAE